MKPLIFVFLLVISNSTKAEWVEYSTRINGDVYFFDSDRVQKNNADVRVWNRVRYKTSVMGASSYQSLLRLNCSDNSETTLQSTFYSDKDWAVPAMATNTRVKPKIAIKTNSATEQLASILCKE